MELAFILPVFGVMLAGIMEFCHASMVSNTLHVAAKDAARYGAVEGITTAQVRDRAIQKMSASFNTTHATILVKNAGVFDTTTVNPGTLNFTQMQDLELSDATSRQLYVVRIEVKYSDVALLPPFWAKTLRLYGQSIMRHE